MARFGSNLLKEKTGGAVLTNTTYNAPGNYTAPYGKSVVRIGGRGASGNPTSPGNVSGNNPANPPNAPYTYYVNVPTYQAFAVRTPCFGGGIVGPFNNGPPPNITFLSDGWAHVHTSGQVVGSYCPGVTVPGNPGNPGNPNYNPTQPGNAGVNSTVGGVYFPGGPAQTTAPVIGATSTTLTYEAGANNLSITVPSGGYITICNI